MNDDLSYSRTFYPNRSVRVYLNQLAQITHLRLYKGENGLFKSLIHFYKNDLPKVMWNSRKLLWLSVICFLISMLIGAFSAREDAGFIYNIFGSQYVHMTINNIEQGNPFGVYQTESQFRMFLEIAANNLQVDFFVFILGFLFGIGALIIAIYNGVMIGTFFYLFYSYGLFEESLTNVMLHGTLELGTIVLSCTAGMTLGLGYVFPGTYSRSQSFKRAAKRSIKIILAVLPLTIIAAWIEGYVTRHSDAPLLLRGGLVIGSLLFLVGYFVVLPWLKARRGFEMEEKEESMPSYPEEIALRTTMNPGAIFSGAFRLWAAGFGKILGLGGLLALGYCLLHHYLPQMGFLGKENFNIFRLFEIISPFEFMEYHAQVVNATQLFAKVLLLSGLLFLSQNIYLGHHGHWKQNWKKALVWSPVYALLICALGFFKDGASLFMILLLAPPIIMAYMAGAFHGFLPHKAIFKSFRLIKTKLAWHFGTVLILCFISALMLPLPKAPLGYIFQEVAGFFAEGLGQNVFPFKIFFNIFLDILGYVLAAMLLFCGFALLHSSLHEVSNANGLKEKIDSIGKKKTAYGFELE